MTDEILHPDTKMGYVVLTVSDLERSLTFYQNVLGFRVHQRQNGRANLGAGGPGLIRLIEQPEARPVSNTAGLYHLAVLVPSRLELAQSLRRIIETRTAVQGFADHLVSEAIYLADPDGNGIEIYRDRPRSEWPFDQGRLKMGTEPLDTEGLLAELGNQPPPWSGLHPDSTMGHVHLHVSNLAQAEAFYRDVVGFELMLRYGPSASFLSAGGYHHHLGINTWAGQDVPPAPAGATGLRWYTIWLPNQIELDRVIDRVKGAGLEPEEQPDGLFLRDPAQNGLMLIT